MSSIFNNFSFITNIINKEKTIASTKLDKSLKAIINTYNSKLNNSNPSFDFIYIVNYINKIRIAYYIKRLEYYNNSKAIEYKGN